MLCFWTIISSPHIHPFPCGKWDVSLLRKERRNWCSRILTNLLLQIHIVSYWMLNTKQIQFMLCSKIALGTIFILCLFERGKFHYDNHSLIFNTINVWLQKQSMDFKLKILIALEVLHTARYMRYWTQFCTKIMEISFLHEIIQVFLIHGRPCWICQRKVIF